MKRLGCLFVAALLAAQSRPPVKPIPPTGVDVPAADRAELQAGLDRLRNATDKLKGNPLLPDVLIYQEALRYALQYNEFFNAGEIAKAKVLLAEGEDRARQLAAGQSAWTSTTGLVVRGYISKIDHSVQPYGLVLPPSYRPDAPHRWRLDAWFRGRTDSTAEIAFLSDREKNMGEFTPRDTIVLHLYGRFCNANKLAGETDFFEALDAVKHNYRIDDNRILIRGFSMGGAAAWHLGGHFAGMWAAVAPGAGFSESPEFLHLKLDGPNAPPSWEQTLYHLYNINDYAVNFANTSTVAYNGEIDPQKQAADVMEKAMAEEGINMLRIVGPNTPHRYHPDSKVEIERIVDAIAERGRDPYPRQIRFTTWTLAYNNMKWVTIDAMGKEWERARLNADMQSAAGIAVETANVTAFTLQMGSGGYPLDLTAKPTVNIDGQKITAAPPMSDRSWTAHFRKSNGKWAVAAAGTVDGVHKVHGLQGPVDDAFLDSFVFVTPTGTPFAPTVATWVASEQKHAIGEWRRQFRGDAQVRDDQSVSDADIAASNLVLWGDPGSNKLLARIAPKLPVKWTAEGLTVNGKQYPATHVPILVYPNPLNPKKYVVLNSGFTFREYDYLNNAQQIPKLPDWAVIDTTTPPDERYPGKVVTAGFFNEDWKF